MSRKFKKNLKMIEHSVLCNIVTLMATDLLQERYFPFFSNQLVRY